MALVTTTTKQEFEDKVLKSEKTVLVDFWAAWCPPCRAMAPRLHNVADKMDSTVDVVKVDIEASADNQQLATEYQVQSIPNMVIFKSGKEADRIIGMVPEAVLEKQLA
ncbi:MAG TPA: thioredoxin [Candidatus Saccharimonadaceae bacterium]|nr:thioredoxin [Candidatus Saccharimonadaceae bacterium]